MDLMYSTIAKKIAGNEMGLMVEFYVVLVRTRQ